MGSRHTAAGLGRREPCHPLKTAGLVAAVEDQQTAGQRGLERAVRDTTAERAMLSPARPLAVEGLEPLARTTQEILRVALVVPELRPPLLVRKSITAAAAVVVDMAMLAALAGRAAAVLAAQRIVVLTQATERTVWAVEVAGAEARELAILPLAVTAAPVSL